MIKLTDASITISNYDTTIFGNIYLQLDDKYFPQKEWNDFAAVVLSWWAREILDLIEGRIEEGIFMFMDGDFGYIIKKSSDGYQLFCYENFHSKRTLIVGVEIELKVYLEDLKNCINSLLRNVKGKNAKLEGLDSYLMDIRQAMSKLDF